MKGYVYRRLLHKYQGEEINLRFISEIIILCHHQHTEAKAFGWKLINPIMGISTVAGRVWERKLEKGRKNLGWGWRKYQIKLVEFFLQSSYPFRWWLSVIWVTGDRVLQFWRLQRSLISDSTLMRAIDFLYNTPKAREAYGVIGFRLSRQIIVLSRETTDN